MIVTHHHAVYVGVVGTPRECFDAMKWLFDNTGAISAHQHPRPCLDDFLRTETYYERHRIDGSHGSFGEIQVPRSRLVMHMPSGDITISEEFLNTYIPEMMGLSFHNEFLVTSTKDLMKIKLYWNVEDL